METTFKRCWAEYDLTAYANDLDAFLTDVWGDAFCHWDAKIDTQAAADMASRTQDSAEYAWRRYHDVPFQSDVVAWL